MSAPNQVPPAAACLPIVPLMQQRALLARTAPHSLPVSSHVAVVSHVNAGTKAVAHQVDRGAQHRAPRADRRERRRGLRHLGPRRPTPGLSNTPGLVCVLRIIHNTRDASEIILTHIIRNTRAHTARQRRMSGRSLNSLIVASLSVTNLLSQGNHRPVAPRRCRHHRAASAGPAPHGLGHRRTVGE